LRINDDTRADEMKRGNEWKENRKKFRDPMKRNGLDEVTNREECGRRQELMRVRKRILKVEWLCSVGPVPVMLVALFRQTCSAVMLLDKLLGGQDAVPKGWYVKASALRYAPGLSRYSTKRMEQASKWTGCKRVEGVVKWQRYKGGGKVV
jgi:hypothetical protein